MHESSCWQDSIPCDENLNWKEPIACMPVARTSFAAVADRQHIYVAGKWNTLSKDLLKRNKPLNKYKRHVPIHMFW